MQRVGREVGGVQLAGAETAERGGDLWRADPRGVEQSGALDELDGGARRGDHRPAAGGLESRRADALPLDREREAHEIATGGAPCNPVRGVADRAAAAAGAQQVILEALVGHGRRV